VVVVKADVHTDDRADENLDADPHKVQLEQAVVVLLAHHVVQVVSRRADHTEQTSHISKNKQDEAKCGFEDKRLILEEDLCKLIQEVEGAEDVGPGVHCLIVELEGSGCALAK